MMVWPYLTIREEKLGLSELVRKYSAKNGFPHFLKNIEILCIRFKILFWNASESKEHTRKILARCWRNIKLVESLAAKLCKFKMWVRRSCDWFADNVCCVSIQSGLGPSFHPNNKVFKNSLLYRMLRIKSYMRLVRNCETVWVCVKIFANEFLKPLLSKHIFSKPQLLQHLFLILHS